MAQYEQAYQVVNLMAKEHLGEEMVVQEDLSNIVDVGTALFNNLSYDVFAKSLIDKVGRVYFINRPYSGTAPKIYMDGATWGSVLQRISGSIPEASVEDSYALNNGTSYDPNVFYAPEVEEKFYAKYITFGIRHSLPKNQVMTAFTSPDQFAGFIAMLVNEVDKAYTVYIDGLIYGTIANMIAETAYADYRSTTTFNDKSGVKAVNLLYKYNSTENAGGTALTAANCMFNKDFIRFATSEIKKTTDRMKAINKAFNIGGKEKFTPADKQHIVLHSEFVNNADFYLQSSTFHDWYTALPKADTVPYWQGNKGDTTSWEFSETGKINVKTSGNREIALTGILGVIFDDLAMGVRNIEKEVDTAFNPVGRFTNYFYHYKAGYFNDQNENFVVFFVA